MASDDELKKAVLEEKEKCTGKISDLCRYIGFGLMGITYTIFSSSSPYSIKLTGEYKTELTYAAFLGAIIIISDYLQFLFGYFSTKKALENKNNQYKYSRKWVSYNLRVTCFWLKQIFTLIGVVTIAATILRSIGPF